MEEPCARTALDSFAGALAFFERGGGVSSIDMLAESALFKSAVEEAKLRLNGGLAVARRQAPRYPLSFVVEFERAVVDASRPVYDRMYAWWCALKVWGVLRHDDNRGLRPADLRLDNLGLSATLLRTKTSGAGKRQEVLPLFVGRAAYVGEPEWLEIGCKLWLESGLDRDYLIALPNRTRDGLLPHEARYTDAAAMTRMLITSFNCGLETSSLAQRGGLLLPVTASFWTEHSGRATLPSWAACVGSFPSDWVNYLGRWAVEKSDTYVRTHRLRVKKIQEEVAACIRGLADAGKALDEDPLFADLARHLRVKGMEESGIANQVELVRLWFTCSRPLIGNPSPNDASGDASAAQEVDPADSSDVPLPATMEDPGFKIEDYLGCYVVSIGSRPGSRRLHQVGSCHLVPGIDYKSFEILGHECPSPELYKDFCRRCWPKASDGGTLTPRGTTSSSSSASASSSGTSSSDDKSD